MGIPKNRGNRLFSFLEDPYPIIVMGTFIWIGFVCSISFMEAWLKFRAPNVSLEIGVGIGRLVFNALNIVEWFLGAVVGISCFRLLKEISWREIFRFALPLAILAVQTFFLLPILNERAEMVLEGIALPFSWIHIYYLTLEVGKVVSLFFLGGFILRRAEFFKGRSQSIQNG